MNTIINKRNSFTKRLITALLAIVIAFGTIMTGAKEAHACGANTCAVYGHCWNNGVTVSGWRGKLLGTKEYTCKRCGKKVRCTNAEFSAKYKNLGSTFRKSGKTNFTNITKQKGALSLRWKKGNNVTGYQIQYSLYSDFRSYKNVTINNCNNTTTRIAGLNNNTKYYIRIRSYKVVDGQVSYSDWSKVRSVKVTAFGFANYSNK